MKTSLAIRFNQERVEILDQTKLPHQEIWIEITHPKDAIAAIQSLAVRGAPLIGVAAAASLGVFASQSKNFNEWLALATEMRKARPTAVNLMHAVDRMTKNLNEKNFSALALFERAIAIFDEDVALADAMANRGASFISDGDCILTHCNSGGLATAGVGTAVGAIIRAHEQGKKITVFADETRPLLQGARLTVWELQRKKIPVTLICDNMAADLMKQKRITKVFVGADRIAANGDFANKIGTYGLAVNARYHSVPFYVVAPQTTLDLTCPTGDQIHIEQRNPDEVRAGKAPADCAVYNPAFDVTPRTLITAILLDDRMM